MNGPGYDLESLDDSISVGQPQSSDPRVQLSVNSTAFLLQHHHFTRSLAAQKKSRSCTWRWYNLQTQWTTTTTAPTMPFSRPWRPRIRVSLHGSPSSSRHHKGSSSPRPSDSTRHRPRHRDRRERRSSNRHHKLFRSARAGRASWCRRASEATPCSCPSSLCRGSIATSPPTSSWGLPHALSS